MKTSSIYRYFYGVKALEHPTETGIAVEFGFVHDCESGVRALEKFAFKCSDAK